MNIKPTGPYHIKEYIVRGHAQVGKTEAMPDIIGVRLSGPAPAPDTKAGKFWNIAASSDDADEGIITLYGDVMSQTPTDWWTGEPEPGLFITPEGFMEDLEAVKGKGRITVKLNSCGGDLYTGIAIHNAIKALKAQTTVIVEGIAASAASVIMCAGDTVQVWPGSIVMIHGVSVGLCDYYNNADLKQIIKGNDAAEKAIAEIYNAKTGLETEALRSMMSKETWLTGREAVDKGFADELLEGEGPEAALLDGKEILMVAGVQHNIKGLHVPDALHIPRISPAALAARPGRPTAGIDHHKQPAPTGTDEGGKDPMINTTEELRQAHPDLVKQIENAAKSEAVAAERARLQAIEEIAPSVGDSDLVREAKYGEKPCTAEALALQAMQKQAKLGTKFLKDSADDHADSGAEGVGSNPNNGGEGGDDVADMGAVVNAVNSTRGGKK